MPQITFDNTYHTDVASPCPSFAACTRHRFPLLILTYLVVLENGRVLFSESRSTSADLCSVSHCDKYIQIPTPQIPHSPELSASDVSRGSTAVSDHCPSFIAIHGLNPRGVDNTRHAWDTWTKPSGPSGRLWLRDDLPHRAPHSRIFLYEYNASLIFGDKARFVQTADALLEAIRVERKSASLHMPNFPFPLTLLRMREDRSFSWPIVWVVFWPSR